MLDLLHQRTKISIVSEKGSTVYDMSSSKMGRSVLVISFAATIFYSTFSFREAPQYQFMMETD